MDQDIDVEERPEVEGFQAFGADSPVDGELPELPRRRGDAAATVLDGAKSIRAIRAERRSWR